MSAPSVVRLSKRKHHLPPLALLLAAAAGLFGLLLLSSGRVVSAVGNDVAAQFFFTRSFGFNELAGGGIPMWNPYLYGGVPFLGDFQSALLYPLNLVFLFLPTPAAINASFFLHTFLLGAFMYAWAVAGRGLRPWAGFTAGMAAMCGGPFFLHVYAGHLSNVCSMAWAPLVFLGIDGWLKHRDARWIILSSSAAALQVYAGHPQYAYGTALVAGLYSLVHLRREPGLRTLLIGLAAIYPLAFLLAAVQILPGLSAASESARSGGVSYDFASIFSFPPESLLTVLFPWLFGRMDAYLGRCYLWEMCLYGGTGMLLLAVFALGTRQAIRGPQGRLALLTLAALVLALGAHTPLHRMLYDWLPGFDFFRGASKFVFFSGLFLALLAGMGADRLLGRDPGTRPGRGFLAAILAAALACAAAATLVGGPRGGDLVRGVINQALSSGEAYFPLAVLQDQERLHAAQETASHALAVGGGSLALFAVLFTASRRRPRTAGLVLAAAAVEVFLFARGTVTSFPAKDITYPAIRQVLQKMPGDFRIINLLNQDAVISLGREGAWGYDPSVLRRWSRLLRQSQGQDPDRTGEYLNFHRPHPVLSLVRCLYVIQPARTGADLVLIKNALPRFFFVTEYEVLPEDRVLEALREPGFNLAEKVLLEENPRLGPAGKVPDTPVQFRIAVIEAGTDHWTLDIYNDRPGILVMTDAWSKDWHATALADSVQTNYRILPADYAIRGIPLARGHHRIRLDYLPSGLEAGLFITLTALAALAGAFFWPPMRGRLDFARTRTRTRTRA